MRLLLLLLILAAAPARAQLESILAPLPTGEDLEQQESALVTALRQDDTVAAPAVAAADPDIHVVQAADVAAAIQSSLQEHFGLEGELRIELARDWRPLKTLETPAFEITEFPASGIKNNFIVRLRVSSGALRAGEWQVPVRAQLWQEIWTAAGRLNRGQALDPALLAVQKVDVLSERETPLAATADPSRFDVAQTVSAGRPILVRDLAERPLVRKGQVVEVVANHGLLTINTKGLALEDGATEQFIRLRNLETRKEFSAQIINENRVKVHF